MFQVSLRTLLEATAFVSFILAIWYLRAENKNGRYGMSVHGPSNSVYVIDSTTGEVWVNHGNGKWVSSAPPVTP